MKIVRCNFACNSTKPLKIAMYKSVPSDLKKIKLNTDRYQFHKDGSGRSDFGMDNTSAPAGADLPITHDPLVDSCAIKRAKVAGSARRK